MGAYSPAPIVTKSLEKNRIKIIVPTLILKEKRDRILVFIYWFNDKNSEPYSIEYKTEWGIQNVRLYCQY